MKSYKTIRVHEDTYKTLKSMSNKTDTPITLVVTQIVNERSEGRLFEHDITEKIRSAKETLSAVDVLLTVNR